MLCVIDPKREKGDGHSKGGNNTASEARGEQLRVVTHPSEDGCSHSEIVAARREKQGTHFEEANQRPGASSTGLEHWAERRAIGGGDGVVSEQPESASSGWKWCLGFSEEHKTVIEERKGFQCE